MNSRYDVAKTAGIIAPPKNPCNARRTIISGSEVASAQASEKAVKPRQEATNSTRVDHSRDRKPESGIITISATR